MAFPFLPIAKVGLGLLGSFLSSKQQGKANRAQEEGLDFARQDIAARQPFRDQLFASLQQGQPQRQDLSNLFGSQNPFAQALGPLNPEAQQTTAPITPPIAAPIAQRLRRGGRSFGQQGLGDRERIRLE